MFVPIELLALEQADAAPWRSYFDRSLDLSDGSQEVHLVDAPYGTLHGQIDRHLPVLV